MSRYLPVAAVIMAALLAVAPPAQAESKAGPQGEPRGDLREQIYLIPNGSGLFGDRYLHATLRRPAGEEPKPLVVINHGSPGESSKRLDMEVKYTAASEWFVKQGFRRRAAAAPGLWRHGRRVGGNLWPLQRGGFLSRRAGQRRRYRRHDPLHARTELRAERSRDRGRAVGRRLGHDRRHQPGATRRDRRHQFRGRARRTYGPDRPRRTPT